VKATPHFSQVAKELVREMLRVYIDSLLFVRGLASVYS
jgi:hypothetical protein